MSLFNDELEMPESDLDVEREDEDCEYEESDMDHPLAGMIYDALVRSGYDKCEALSMVYQFSDAYYTDSEEFHAALLEIATALGSRATTVEELEQFLWGDRNGEEIMDRYSAISEAGVPLDFQSDAANLYYLLLWQFADRVQSAPDEETVKRAAHKYAIEKLRKIYVERDEEATEILWDELAQDLIPQGVDILRALGDLLAFIPEYPFDQNEVNWRTIYEEAAEDWSNYISPSALESATDFRRDSRAMAALYAFLERIGYGYEPNIRLSAILDADRDLESLEHLFRVIGDLLGHQFVLPASTLLNVFAHPMLQDYTRYHEDMLAEQRENDDYYYEPQTRVHFPYSEALYKRLLEYGEHPRDAGFAMHDLDSAYAQMQEADKENEARSEERAVLNKVRALLQKCAEDVPDFTDFSDLLAYCERLFTNEGAFEVEESTAPRNPLDERFEAVEEYARTEVRMIPASRGFHIPSDVLNATDPYKQLGIVTTAAREARLAVTAMPDAAGAIMAILYRTYVDHGLPNFARAVAGAWASGADLMVFLKKLEGVE